MYDCVSALTCHSSTRPLLPLPCSPPDPQSPILLRRQIQIPIMVLISELSPGSSNPIREISRIQAQGAEKSSGSGDDGGVPCPAMMEVVLTDGGRWTVSRAVVGHSHGSLTVGPTVGMEFDSVSAAEGYYAGCGEKSGFGVKLGEGKRSGDERDLVVQRFVCEKGISEGEVVRKCKKGNRIELDVVSCEDDCDERNSTESKEGESGKVALVSNPGQSKLLRELGIRVSKYSHEERRDIISKYMQKRSNRQVINRTSTKIPSRQALAERRQRGLGGKFLSKEKSETSNKQDEKENATQQEEQEKQLEQNQLEEEMEINLSPEIIKNANGVPIIGMEFESEEKAYEYYVNYASKLGFSIRKTWSVKNPKNQTTATARVLTFVCSKEGFRPKRVRPETRTGCTAKMSVKIYPDGKIRVSEFSPDHNHPLSKPLDIDALKSQRALTLTEVKVKPGFDRVPDGYRNYLRAKRSNEILEGDTGALLEYFNKMKSRNPNFYFAVQVDESDEMANFFWADVKNILDYQKFGDVVCFDTTFRVSNYDRPLALFLGQNNLKQIVLFGTALIYDETVESFNWIFETFKSCMGSTKQPKTVLTERCEIISQSVAATWRESVHRFCTYQIYQNALKEIGFAFQFGPCLFSINEEEEFLATWDSMLERENLKENEWLNKLFLERESWALPYNRHVFFAEIESSLKDENFCSLFEDPLSPANNLVKFLDLFENFWGERNKNVEKLNFEANNKPIKNPLPTVRILWQAASLYTPIIFEDFMSEYKLITDCFAYNCDEFGPLSEFLVRVKNMQKEHLVRFDSSNNNICCTCKKFEHVGIFCCHILKIFEVRNIQEMDEKYILDRWRKDGKFRGLSEKLESNNTQDKFLYLYNNFYKIANKASENEEMFLLMVNQTDQWLEQVERILHVGPVEKLNCMNSGLNNNNGENVKRRKNQSDFDANKRQKMRKDLRRSEEIQQREENDQNAPSNNNNNHFLNPSHLMQGQFLIPPQFALTASHTLNNITQFPQPNSLSQQQFPSTSRLPQGYSSAEIQALQYIGSNQQNTDQGQGSVPVWDFL
ncbi:hypothetical protein LUZ60_009009 [Juncus effusus]|nr:hypothetical protein LUZ60_009009 [Juncus effusus]